MTENRRVMPSDSYQRIKDNNDRDIQLLLESFVQNESIEKVLLKLEDKFKNIPFRSVLDKSEIESIESFNETFKATLFPIENVAKKISTLKDYVSQLPSYFKDDSMHASLSITRDLQLQHSDFQVALILASGYIKLIKWAMVLNNIPQATLIFIIEATYFTAHAESIFMELERAKLKNQHKVNSSSAGKKSGEKRADQSAMIKGEVAKRMIVNAPDGGWKTQTDAITKIEKDVIDFHTKNPNSLTNKDIHGTIKKWLETDNILKAVYDATKANTCVESTEPKTH